MKMDKSYKVSCIITTYKRPPEIVQRAVKSVCNQTYSNLEIIVVDDSPASFLQREEVKKSVMCCDTGIVFVQHETNKGACEARNTGLMIATGELIAYLDDDDEWLPTKIEKQVNKYLISKAALIYCGHYEVDEINCKEYTYNTKYYCGKVFDKLIMENFVGSTSYSLIEKKALLEIGGFDPLMQSSQDYDVWLRLSEKNSINYVAEELVKYHIHANEQITSNPKKKILGLERINEKFILYISKHKKVYWHRFTKIIPYYVMNSQKDRALKTWYDCFIKCPEYIVGNLRYLLWAIGMKNKREK